MPPVTVWRELRRIKGEHEDAPDDVDRLLKYVRALRERESAALEDVAIKVLLDAHERLGQYRFKKDVGDIRMKQYDRKLRELEAQHKAKPDDALLQIQKLMNRVSPSGRRETTDDRGLAPPRSGAARPWAVPLSPLPPRCLYGNPGLRPERQRPWAHFFPPNLVSPAASLLASFLALGLQFLLLAPRKNPQFFRTHPRRDKTFYRARACASFVKSAVGRAASCTKPNTWISAAEVL